MATKQQKLESIQYQILEAHVAPELASQATQLVFGDGNPDAQIVLIGEAPGQNEDKQGKPFVGAAGKFLNEMLESIGLKRQDMYITNIVKYRPPNNRDPFPAEKKVFLPYLQAQLEVIQPKLVVTLGRHAGSCFLPDLQISHDHGQAKRIRINIKAGAEQKEGQPLQQADGQAVMTLVVLPLFHPAAALYNGSLRQTLMEDFAKIPAILTKLS